MWVRQMYRHAIVVLVLLAPGCGGTPPPSGPAPPGQPAEDAAAADARVTRPGDGAVTPQPPQGTGDAAAAVGTPDAAAATPTPLGGPEVVVEAGELDRQDTIVSFMHAAGAGKRFVLRDGQTRLPVQVDADGRAVFVLPALKAGARATFVLEPDAEPAAAGVTVVKEADGVKLNLGAATILRYQTTAKAPAGVGGNFLRGGYIHPLFTPAGLLVTDDYPGDHRHHHGIWSAWAHTHFEGRQMDFWNMGGGSAKVDFESLAATWEGAVHGGLRARHLHTDLRAPGGPKTALREEWVVTAYQLAAAGATAPAYFVFDLDSTQEAASASPVNLDQYIYGGFAFRGSAQRATASFLTSEGRDRGAGDNTTGRWCYVGSRIDGKPAGYVVLGHPGNFRAPQPMRINPTDPFFSFSPVKPSGFTIMQGSPYVTRFRIVVVDAAADKALFDRLWNDYARPPMVEVRPAK